MFSIRTTVEQDLSVDPSYIIKYQVYENNQFIGDGVTQYYRLAEHNDFHISDTILTLNRKPLPEAVKNEIKKRITDTAKSYLHQRGYN